MNNDHEEKTFIFPKPSRATRTPPARSKASSRGIITARLPADTQPTNYCFESKLEQKVFYLLSARADTYAIQEQSAAILFTDSRGKQRQHIPDFLLTQRCKTKVAISVKSSNVAERTGYRRELARVRAAMPLSYAKNLVLITDRSFSPAQARNAERLHEFRRHPDNEADTEIAAILRTLVQPTKIEAIVKTSNLEGRGFRAVFRAIYAGLARPIAQEDILPSTFVMGMQKP